MNAADTMQTADLQREAVPHPVAKVAKPPPGQLEPGATPSVRSVP